MKETKKAIYVIEQNGLYKVGMSAAPAERMKALRLGLPEVNLVHVSDCIYNARAVELCVHAELADRAVGHEWFSGLSTGEITAIVDRAVAEHGEFERKDAPPHDPNYIANTRVRRLLRRGQEAAGEDDGPESVYIGGNCIPLRDRMVVSGVEHQVCTSVDLSEEIGLKHNCLLRRFRNMRCSGRFREENFLSGSYSDAYGRLQPLLIMNSRGTLSLLTTCTSEKAVLIREMIMESI